MFEASQVDRSGQAGDHTCIFKTKADEASESNCFATRQTSIFSVDIAMQSAANEETLMQLRVRQAGCAAVQRKPTPAIHSQGTSRHRDVSNNLTNGITLPSTQLDV